MVKLVENKKLLYGDCKWKSLRRKDLDGFPNTMQDPRYTMHDAGDSIYPFALSLSKCGHVQFSLTVMPILEPPEMESLKACDSSFCKGGLRGILHGVHRWIGGPHRRFNSTVEKIPFTLSLS